MSAREWKPGDVAAVAVDGHPELIAIFTTEGQWVDADHMTLEDASPDTNYRPLVVIDPEDRKQVERLGEAIRLQGRCGLSGLCLCSDRECIAPRVAAALREFANPTPPKPEEPTGLGAVVESDDGSTWVRTDTTTSNRWIRSAFGDRVKWSDIPTPLRVLSEGVTA